MRWFYYIFIFSAWLIFFDLFGANLMVCGCFIPLDCGCSDYFYFIVVFYPFKLFMYKELLCIFLIHMVICIPYVCIIFEQVCYVFWCKWNSLGNITHLLPNENPWIHKENFFIHQKYIGGKNLWNFINQILSYPLICVCPILASVCWTRRFRYVKMYELQFINKDVWTVILLSFCVNL